MIEPTTLVCPAHDAHGRTHHLRPVRHGNIPGGQAMVCEYCHATDKEIRGDAQHWNRDPYIEAVARAYPGWRIVWQEFTNPLGSLFTIEIDLELP